MTRTFLCFRDGFARWSRASLARSVAGLILALLSVRAARGETQGYGTEAPTDGEYANQSFAASFGLESERRALDLGGAERLRALQRLRPLAQRVPKQVAELLDGWLASEPKLSPLETWALLRPMAPLGRERPIREYLTKILAGEALTVDPKSPYAPLIPQVAALALAKHHTTESVSLLAEWLRRPSERARVVQLALLAHPPRDISPLLEANGPATPVLLQTLGELGNPAAIPFLRRVVKRATADRQAAAAVALAKLGVSETQDLANLWLARSDSPGPLLQASAFILFWFQHPARAAAFSRLVRADVGLALELAEHVSPEPALAALSERLTELQGRGERVRAVRVLGRLGPKAVPLLATILETDADLRWQAARALGEASAPLASIRSLLDAPETRAATLSALVVASVRHPDAGLPTLLADLVRASGSASPQERGIGKTGLALLDETRARRYLRSQQPDELEAAAIAAAVHGGAYLQAALLELERRATPDAGRGVRLDAGVVALSSLLSFVSPSDIVSERLLQALANSEYPIASTASWHLWVRGGITAGIGFTARRPPSLRARLAGSTKSGQVNQHDELFTLLDAASSEPDPTVRAAIVNSLRSGPNLRSIAETLDWLANYDPSRLVRNMAAAKGTDESVLRPIWTVAPAKPSAPYWITVQSADRAPVALYLSHGENAVAFVPTAANAMPADMGELDSPSSVGAFLHQVEDSGAIPLRTKAVLHPIHPSR